MKDRTHYATVYDAVAGRVTLDGFEESPAQPQSLKSKVPLRPDEVLFRSRNAPERYEEDDIYNADSKLRPDQKLPDSDLLKAIHVYASEFYANAPGTNSKKNFYSMDETALLAMGILMEEAAREVIGETGDLVFTEAEDHDVVLRPKRYNGVLEVDSVVDHTSTRIRKQEHERLQALLDANYHPDATKTNKKKRARSRSAR